VVAIGWLGVAVTLVWCVLRVYERLAGENPIADTAYDLWLRRQELTVLDRSCAENPNKANVIVTLTTLPSRMERIELTIKSLLRQTVSPASIRVNIPDRSRREDARYHVPRWLAACRSVMIDRCDDFGPATKLIPSLLDAAPGQRLLVVDDDRVYHPHFIEQMVAHADANPGVAVAASGWNAPADLTDRPTTLLATLGGRPPAPIKCTRVRTRREIDVMQGLSGYLVEPRFFDRAELIDYSRAPAAAFFVDDVWISAHCRVPKVIVHGRRTNFPSLFDARFFKRSSVALVNRGTGSPASRNNTIMLRYFADRWRSHRSYDGRSPSATGRETGARACD
jgi:hypothetical protein